MFCSKCGAKGNAENQFCQDCGNQLRVVNKEQGTAKQHEKKVESQTVSNESEWVNTAKEAMNPTLQTEQRINLKNPRLPIIIAAVLVIIVALVLIVDLPSGNRGDRSQGVGEVGFDTPEEVLIFYLEGLRDSNLEQMVSAFAIESFIENYNLEAQIDRVQAYNFWMEVVMPNTNDFVVSMNVENRRGRVVGSIIQQFFMLSQVDFDISRPVLMGDYEGESRDFVNQLEEYLGAPDLEALEIIGVIMPEDLSDIYQTELNQANMERVKEVHGADEIVSRVIVFEIGRDQYLLFADLINYGGQWHIMNFQGNIGNLVGISHMRSGLLSPEYVDWYLEDVGPINRLIIPIDDLE